MTTSLKVKIVRKRSLRLKVLPTFPAGVNGTIAIAVDKQGGGYTIRPDYTIPGEITAFDPSNQLLLVYDRSAQSYSVISLASVLNNTLTSVRVVTEAGDITVGPNTRILIMNRTADESPSRIFLPTASAKIGDILVVDWKGNAGSFRHDVYPNGTEKFNGNQASWRVDGNGASVRFSPVTGLGYAV